MNNNPQISNNNFNISTSASRETLQNSHNVTNLKTEPSSNSKNRDFSTKNINYKERILQVPMLPGENSFKNNSKEAKSDIQTIPQQFAGDNNDQWLKLAPKIIAGATQIKKISFDKKKHSSEAALHKIAQPLTQFKTIAPRGPKQSTEIIPKAKPLINNAIAKSSNDKGVSNSNRSQERFILPKNTDSSSNANSLVAAQKISNPITQITNSQIHNQPSSTIDHCTNLVNSLNINSPNMPVHIRPAISPRSSSDKLPNDTETQNLIPIRSENSTNSQPSPPPSERSSPNFHVSGPGQKSTSDTTTASTNKQTSKNQATKSASGKPAAASTTNKGIDIIVISDDNDSDCELVFDASSFSTPKLKPQSDKSSSNVNSNQQGVDKSVFTKNDQLLLNSKLKAAQITQDKLDTTTQLQSDQRPITAHSSSLEKLIKEITENEILPTISKSKIAQSDQDKLNTSANISKTQTDQSSSNSHLSELALSKMTLDPNGKHSNSSKPKTIKKSKNKSTPQTDGAKNKKISTNVGVKVKRPASDKNSSSFNSKSQDSQSALKKAKTGSQKDPLSQETIDALALLASVTNPDEIFINKNITKEPKSTKMVCKKTSIKPSEKTSLISKAIAQAESVNNDKSDKKETKTKTYAVKTGHKSGTPKPNINIKLEAAQEESLSTYISKDTQKVEKEVDVTTSISVEISKASETQLPSPRSTTETESTEVDADPHTPKSLHIRLEDIPVIYEESEEAVYTERDFEIECIIGRRLNNGKKQRQYLVKWRGYDVNLSTWVDSSELSCADLIRTFNLSMESKKGGRTSRIADETKKEQFLPDELEKFLILLNNDDDAAISVVNDVDNAPAPNFTYVNSLVLHPDVILDPTESNFIASCSCSRSCKLVNSSTAQKSCLKSHEPYSYLADGSLYNPYVKLIYECNSKCKCNLKCTNRIVQRGRTVQLQIFRTKHKGWGVRTLQDIPKGRFVCKYTGLVITSDHAEVIGKEYDQRGSTYLFDLDAETSEDKKSAQDLCIDANSYGNLSRFINHSCSPNLGVYSVVTDSLSVYDLSFFTLRPVKKYEELFIDYSGGVEITNLEDKKKASKCYCMSSNCKGYLFM